ncbi:hypothetical protein [Lacticaseibacillus kribbianus]|uniref:hypothetical protein n=1 Tax=Lacticaseibacillus kribbianus TaxID=2926292 RepID=UPI001CD241DF|nr:hypothetical protein [Lacticaseibacillus kribbianus]
MMNLWVTHHPIPVVLTYAGQTWPTTIPAGVGFATADETRGAGTADGGAAPAADAGVPLAGDATFAAAGEARGASSGDTANAAAGDAKEKTAGDALGKAAGGVARVAARRIVTPWQGSATVAWPALATGAAPVDSRRFMAQPSWIYPDWVVTAPIGAKLGGVKPRLLHVGDRLEIQQARRVDQDLFLYVVRVGTAELTVKLPVAELVAKAAPLRRGRGVCAAPDAAAGQG